MKLSPTLSHPHDLEGCQTPHQRSGRIDSGEADAFAFVSEFLHW